MMIARLSAFVSPLAVAALGVGTALAAQAPVAEPVQKASTTRALRLPDTVTVFGPALPSVVKATAIVNGEIITQSDIDQRLALMAIANGAPIPQDQLADLRQQILRNLIDETLQIQAARAEDITVSKADVDKAVGRVAENVKMTPAQLSDYLKSNGSSIRSIRRQIEGEMSWSRLLREKIESGVSVGDDEVQAVIDRLNAAKGTEEYRLGEIFLSSTPATDAQVAARAEQIFARLRQGESFVAYARQFSEASTVAVGGDLGWVRAAQLSEGEAEVVRAMRANTVSRPIKVPGGYKILAVTDVRKVLTSDPRNAVLNLRQVSISFPKGTTSEQANPLVARFGAAAQSVGGCGGVDKLVADFKAEQVESDGVKMQDLPVPLQEMMAQMQVGQATRPFGSIEDGVRVLVLCGRDEVDPTAPSFDQVFAQINEERVNVRARRYLRDLRRDAVIDFR